MKNIFTKIFTAIVVVALLGLASCKKLSSYDGMPSEGSPYQIMSDDAVYANFKTAVDRAGLQAMFTGDTEYTYFLPSADALNGAGLNPAALQNWAVADAAAFVKSHVVAGKVDPATVTAPLTSLSGRPINITKQGNRLYADANDITRANIVVKGGSLNTINGILYTQNSLLDVVRNYQHVTANNRIDMTLAAITRASTGSTNFNTLLSGTDNYTFFAPTNLAWISYGYAAVANINSAPVETLVSILKYHLIPGAKLTSAFDSVGVASYNGSNIYFNRYFDFRTTQYYANGVMFGNGTSNIATKNGVVNIIPWVLRPPATKNTLEQIQSDASLSVFYAAILRASTADPAYNFQTMLSGTTPYTVFAVNNAGMAAAGFANVAAVNAVAPEDLAKIVKLHILPKRVHYITVAGTAVNSLLVTKNAAGVSVSNPLSFSTAFTVVANGAGTFRIRGAGNPADYAVTSANTTTTNGMLNIVPTLLVP